MVLMLEKLKIDYEGSQQYGNGGHAICFEKEDPEIVTIGYEFENAIFTLRKQNGAFFWWDYDLKKNIEEKK